ncbi:MAG: bifunctional phosphopantothenoylcysteine decarboxylase/phosphopantothenate--cysteine ligase CoaBC [Paludibacteraceae bacterium]|nr:bifunctional phosphopantothenoylcysteine decarboxylase/phosphopantothenate--cysteine ligase CoaBC [Paludibacteraceae bacterium]
MKGKHILIGVTGGIAAYKTAYLIRDLVKRGAEVKVIMTEKAKAFITPLTLATLSKNPILVDFFDPTNGAWNSHVSLGLWADAYVIAPATANTIAKMAHGIADNLLTTTYLSARCPVFVAPAMDLDMYAHPTTQENIEYLKSKGVNIIDAASGFLASGLEGKGRMAEPEDIANQVSNFFASKQELRGKKVLITAGPTHEKIDPVRFIGNHSSGKMGYALAEECAARGADVYLVSGPVQIKAKHPNIKTISVVSAGEMFEAASAEFDSSDITILCAAVADFRPETQADEKIKREKDDLVIRLKPTQDIAANLGSRKKENQILVGFALETNNEAENAQGKLKRKNLDFIVLNSLKDENACFGYDTNKITIIEKNGNTQAFSLKSKTEVAKDIIDKVCKA